MVRHVLNSVLPDLFRARHHIRSISWWRAREGRGRRFFAWALGNSSLCVREASGQLQGSVDGAADHRHHAPVCTLSNRNSSEPMVAHLRCGLSARGGLGSCREAARPGDDPERLRTVREAVVLADGGTARVRDLESSKAAEGRDYRSRLEAFFNAAAVPDPSDAAGRLAGRYRTLSELLNAEPVIVAEDAGVAAAAVLSNARDLMVLAADDELRARKQEGPSSIAAFLKTLIGFRCDECVVAIFLDARHGVIDHEIISFGRVDSATMDARRILLRAIARGAVGIIVAHNHPSGDPRPSTSDLRVTRELADTCRGLGIHLRDHLVVSGGEVRSAMFQN